MLTIAHPRDERAERSGKTLMIACGPDMSGWHGLQDLLEAVGGYVDGVRMATLDAITIPDSYLEDTLRLYDQAGIKRPSPPLCFFEHAYLKSDIDAVIERLKSLNLVGAVSATLLSAWLLAPSPVQEHAVAEPAE